MPNTDMPWQAVAASILADLMPTVVKLMDIWMTGNPPTPDEWKALESKGYIKSRQHMTAMLLLAGIDPASDKGKAFLDLTPV